ncbi:unnamed protein product [Clonostachys rhizophaga]|uniref:Xylanolytic transcriptional activator regulatory domain-containing protein n=1 Tax=Clonostachys rhizophaga TaxID=160324 RepID=A0A9N9YMI9_9HYPO|nr:unnamed protein product [Clonostachys rhizophaga]
MEDNVVLLEFLSWITPGSDCAWYFSDAEHHNRAMRVAFIHPSSYSTSHECHRLVPRETEKRTHSVSKLSTPQLPDSLSRVLTWETGVESVMRARSNVPGVSLAPTVPRTTAALSVYTPTAYGVSGSIKGRIALFSYVLVLLTWLSSYIDELLDEIALLRQAGRPFVISDTTPPTSSQIAKDHDDIDSNNNGNEETSLPDSASAVGRVPPAASDAVLATPGTESGDCLQNPVLGNQPWFLNLTPEMPLLIGEATDVAFATRFRQELSGASQNHLPRVDYVQDDIISSLGESKLSWPTPSRARFLLKVCFNTVCRRHYLVRKSSTAQLLEEAIRNPAACDKLSVCKLFALFALGEIYSTRTCISGDTFPGILYYLSASRMLSVLSEQPRIDCVEIMMMLSIYSLAMNRRHSGYCLVGYAVRFSILMGLHLNVPRTQLPSCELHEHRIRIWWTVYSLDRLWACMLGKPVSIQNEDIDVNLPSKSDLFAESFEEDVADADYLTASLRIANLGAHITASIYGRRTHDSPISRRVQQALQDLSTWLEQLPGPLHVALDQVLPNSAMPMITLFVYFNQCLIIASRPVLLHTLRQYRNSREQTTAATTTILPPSETALSLSETCIKCARRSYRILTESWINGAFPTFDFTFTQYLFSASTILAMSSLLQGSQSQTDGDDFESAGQILKQLSDNGNYSAKEFCRHIRATESVLEKYRIERSQVPDDQHSQLIATVANATSSSLSSSPNNALAGFSGSSFAESPLHGFLSQRDADFQFLDSAFVDDDFQSLFFLEDSWPSR